MPAISYWIMVGAGRGCGNTEDSWPARRRIDARHSAISRGPARGSFANSPPDRGSERDRRGPDRPDIVASWLWSPPRPDEQMSSHRRSPIRDCLCVFLGQDTQKIGPQWQRQTKACQVGVGSLHDSPRRRVLAMASYNSTNRHWSGACSRKEGGARRGGRLSAGNVSAPPTPPARRSA